jgi:hypothetical protein
MMPDTDTYKPKYMTWWEEDFLSDRKVMRMPSLARHFYRALLQAALFCQTRPYLPYEETELMILADAEPNDWTTHRDAVMAMFGSGEFNGTPVYYQNRLLEQWQTMLDKQKNWQEMGRRSATKRSTTVQPRLSSGSTEQDVEAEAEADVEKTTQQAAAARRDAPTSPSRKTETANPAAGVSPERQTIAREHFAKLVASGDKWALANQGDDSAFKRPAFVEHVLSSEPKKSGRKCKCGRPKPCDLHDLKGRNVVPDKHTYPHDDLEDML